jgi:hypothetical protein
MIENLEEILLSLPKKDVSRFALACAETLWVSFKPIYEKEYKGDAAAIDQNIHEAWSVLSGELDEVNVSELESAARAQVPDMDDYDDIYETEWRSAQASSAQNASISVWIAISGLQSETVKKAMECIKVTYNTLDLLINTKQSIEKGDDFEYDDAYVQQHPLAQAEQTRQQYSLAALKGGDTADFRSSFVRAWALDSLGINQ